MAISRRRFLQAGAVATVSAALSHQPLIAYAAQKGVKFKVGVTDWNLRQTRKIESIALAKKIGFDGVQVSTSTSSSLPGSLAVTQQTFSTSEILSNDTKPKKRDLLDIFA